MFFLTFLHFFFPIFSCLFLHISQFSYFFFNFSHFFQVFSIFHFISCPVLKKNMDYIKVGHVVGAPHPPHSIWHGAWFLETCRAHRVESESRAAAQQAHCSYDGGGGGGKNFSSSVWRCTDQAVLCIWHAREKWKTLVIYIYICNANWSIFCAMPMQQWCGAMSMQDFFLIVAAPLAILHNRRRYE